MGVVYPSRTPNPRRRGRLDVCVLEEHVADFGKDVQAVHRLDSLRKLPATFTVDATRNDTGPFVAVALRNLVAPAYLLASLGLGAR